MEIKPLDLINIKVRSTSEYTPLNVEYSVKLSNEFCVYLYQDNDSIIVINFITTNLSSRISERAVLKEFNIKDIYEIEDVPSDYSKVKYNRILAIEDIVDKCKIIFQSLKRYCDNTRHNIEDLYLDINRLKNLSDIPIDYLQTVIDYFFDYDLIDSRNILDALYIVSDLYKFKYKLNEEDFYFLFIATELKTVSKLNKLLSKVNTNVQLEDNKDIITTLLHLDESKIDSFMEIITIHNDLNIEELIYNMSLFTTSKLGSMIYFNCFDMLYILNTDILNQLSTLETNDFTDFLNKYKLLSKYNKLDDTINDVDEFFNKYSEFVEKQNQGIFTFINKKERKENLWN